MALWEQVLKAPDHIKERILGQYGDAFPLEVRHYLSDVIEEKIL